MERPDKVLTGFVKEICIVMCWISIMPETLGICSCFGLLEWYHLYFPCFVAVCRSLLELLPGEEFTYFITKDKQWHTLKQNLAV